MSQKKTVQYQPAQRGLVHAYIGNGKGKTSAAVGVAVRACGYDWPVLFLQFMKEERWPSGERTSLRKLGVDVKVMGQGFYKIMNDRKKPAEHKQAAAAALRAAAAAITSGKYRLVILDELGSAVEEGLLARSPAEAMLRARIEKAPGVHLIITGHKRISWLLKYCDLITDMTKVRHPFDRGILAVKGIDY